MLRPFNSRDLIAYFSMEVAVRADIPTYSGGLGILAGDILRSAADLGLPMVGVSLVSRHGYFSQTLTPEGHQGEEAEIWEPERMCTPLGAKVSIAIEGREVWVRAWLHVVEGHLGEQLPVLFLDTDLDENDAADRELTHFLYGGDATYRFKQEIILGIGGMRMLRALGFRVRKYHMNEGHAALLALELLRSSQASIADMRPGESPYDVPLVRSQCDFTTHTPIGAGRDEFDYAVVNRLLQGFVDDATLRQLGGAARLDMSRLAINLSGYVNGVAKRHAETSRNLFPGYAVRAVTNGVHAYTWVSPAFAKIFDRHLPGWCNEPEILVRADCCVGADAIWQAHLISKNELLQYVRESTGVQLDLEQPILGFARRMTSYKRPELLFSDLERLRSIARRMPFQIVLAGKAHPRDMEGKERIVRVHAALRALAPEIKGVYLNNYNMTMAKLLVAGADVWLNTPQPPLEASGTSGMKAAMNGVPSLSVLDGWWAEGCIEGVTGWAIGDGRVETAISDAASLYEKLEQQVLPLYRNRAAWTYVMKGAISRNGSLFNSHRMMRRYASEAYL
jgi:starch phosphorylase